MIGRGRGSASSGGAAPSGQGRGSGSWRSGGTTTYKPPHARHAAPEAPISRDGLRKATGQVGRQLSEMEMLLSPSRGEGSSGQQPSLTDRSTQEKFREHINAKIARLASSHPPGGTAEQATRRREELGIVLLDLRKLREGLTALRRVDNFTVGVYVDSIKLAVEADNLPQLGATLPHFVFDILPKLAQQSVTATRSADDVSDSLAGLSLNGDGQTKVDTELIVFYQSLYLLYLICHLADLASFHSTLNSFTSPSPATATQQQAPASLSTSPSVSSSPLAPSFLYTQRVFAALAANNYVAFSRLVPAGASPPQEGYTPSEMHLSIARLAVPRLRDQAWAALAKSYKVFTDFEWLGRALMFPASDVEGVKAYLKSRGVAVE